MMNKALYPMYIHQKSMSLKYYLKRSKGQMEREWNVAQDEDPDMLALITRPFNSPKRFSAIVNNLGRTRRQLWSSWYFFM